VRSWRAMVQVAMSTKTNKVGTAAPQSLVLPLRSEGGSPPPSWTSTGKEDTRDVWSEGSRGGHFNGYKSPLSTRSHFCVIVKIAPHSKPAFHLSGENLKQPSLVLLFRHTHHLIDLSRAHLCLFQFTFCVLGHHLFSLVLLGNEHPTESPDQLDQLG